MLNIKYYTQCIDRQKYKYKYGVCDYYGYNYAYILRMFLFIIPASRFALAPHF